jgi:hypothetical protein
MRPLLLFSLMLGAVSFLGHEISVAQESGQPERNSASWVFTDEPLATAVLKLNAVQHARITLQHVSGEQIRVTGGVRGANVPELIRDMLRGYNYVLQTADGERWLLSTYGPVPQHRDSVENAKVRIAALAPSKDLEPGWVERRGPEGIPELVRDPNSGWEAGTQSAELSRLKPSQIVPIEQDGPDGIPELLMADELAPSKDIPSIVQPAGDSERARVWIESVGPDGIPETFWTTASDSTDDLKQTPSLFVAKAYDDGVEYIEIEGPDGIQELIPVTTSERTREQYYDTNAVTEALLLIEQVGPDGIPEQGLLPIHGWSQ